MRISDWSSDLSLPIFPPVALDVLGLLAGGRAADQQVGAVPAVPDGVHLGFAVGSEGCEVEDAGLLEQVLVGFGDHVCHGTSVPGPARPARGAARRRGRGEGRHTSSPDPRRSGSRLPGTSPPYRCAVAVRSEEHTSELQSLMRISYAVFCLK